MTSARTVIRAACVLTLLVVVGACGGSGDDTSDEAGTVETSVPAGDTSDSGSASTTAATATEDTISDTVDTTVPEVVEDPGVADELGLAPIELLTAAEGGGSRPLLEWGAIDGAARYHVVVLAPNQSTYWAWRTADTSVPVGGLPQLSPEAAGPSISPGMSWSVLAVADDGTPIALSGRRPIAP